MNRVAGVPARIAVVVCLASAATFAQSPPQSSEPRPQVFRGGTNQVYVDVYPRHDDKFVVGLTASNFQVFEDGKPQAIQTFEYIRFEPDPWNIPRRDPTSLSESDREAADPRNRVFVVYLDTFHTTRLASRDARQPVLDFLYGALSANDLFALLTPEMPVGELMFRRSTDALTSEFQRLGDWGTSDEGQEMLFFTPKTPDENRLLSCGAGPRILLLFREDEFFTSLDGLMIRLGALRDERKNLLLVSSLMGFMHGDNGRASGRATGLPPTIVVRGGELYGNPERARQTVWCQNQIARLEKMDFERRFRELVAAAERSNVSFYTVDPGGLRVTGGSLLGPLNTLAGATDGYAIVNTNDISIGLRRVAARLSAYYLLSYASTNSANDGRYRKIEVKVNQPHVSVAARPGYFGPVTDAVLAAAIAKADEKAGPVVADAVTGELGRLARLGTQEVFSYAVARTDALDVITELGVHETDRGTWAGGAEVDVTVTDSTGAVATAHEKIATGKRGVSIRVPIEKVRTGPWRVRARVKGEPGSFDDQTQVAAVAAAVLGRPAMFRANQSPPSGAQPVAEFLFRRTERLRVEWPVLATLDQRSARLLDRRGQPLAANVTLAEGDSGAGQRTLTADLAIGGLAAGDYLVELSVTSGGSTIRDVIAFRVER